MTASSAHAEQKRRALERANGPMPTWSRGGHADDWQKLGEQQWDVLVIGGGITGCGVALDAAARGLKVALVEKHDFASGTSSRSSKLIHGGLRYLREGQFSVTRESSREKRCIKELAPHLVDDLPFLLASPRGFWNRFKLHIGLTIYDRLAKYPSAMRHKRLSQELAKQRMPGLCEQRYDGGFLFYDGRADDCRLTLHVAKSAVKQGATLLNYVKVLDLSDNTAVVRNEITNAVQSVQAASIVLATGVWCDELHPSDQALVRPSMGVHLIFDAADVPCQDAVILPTPGTNGAVFLIRDGSDVIAGTSDEFYDGALDQPTPLADHVDTILRRINSALPKAKLRREQIRSSYAGLRPLLQAEGSDATKLSRDEVVLGEAPGVITITGGKLTTYRKMAADVVDRVVEGLGKGVRNCFTNELPLFAFPGMNQALPSESNQPPERKLDWLRAYGTELYGVEDFSSANGGAEPLVAGRSHTVGEARYLLDYERAMTLSDLLCRRTRLANYEWEASQASALKIAVALREHTEWDAQQEVQQFWQESKQFQEQTANPAEED